MGVHDIILYIVRGHVTRDDFRKVTRTATACQFSVLAYQGTNSAYSADQCPVGSPLLDVVKTFCFPHHHGYSTCMNSQCEQEINIDALDSWTKRSNVNELKCLIIFIFYFKSSFFTSQAIYKLVETILVVKRKRIWGKITY